MLANNELVVTERSSGGEADASRVDGEADATAAFAAVADATAALHRSFAYNMSCLACVWQLEMACKLRAHPLSNRVCV